MKIISITALKYFQRRYVFYNILESNTFLMHIASFQT